MVTEQEHFSAIYAILLFADGLIEFHQCVSTQIQSLHEAWGTRCLNPIPCLRHVLAIYERPKVIHAKEGAVLRKERVWQSSDNTGDILRILLLQPLNPLSRPCLQPSVDNPPSTVQCLHRCRDLPMVVLDESRFIWCQAYLGDVSEAIVKRPQSTGIASKLLFRLKV